VIKSFALSSCSAAISHRSATGYAAVAIVQLGITGVNVSGREAIEQLRLACEDALKSPGDAETPPQK
jgi:hypothetical protein